MTKQSASAEASNLARRIRNELGGEPFLTAREAAEDIDALCEQRVSSETKRIVEIIKAIAKIYVNEAGFGTGWHMACERIMLHIIGDETKEQTHRRRYYDAFHAWFMQSGCDFWNECDAPESLATIAVELHDNIKAEAAEKAAILDFVVDGKIGDDPTVKRAQEVLDGMPDCLRLYLEKAGADDRDFEVIQAWLVAALSAKE
jgi:nitrogenase molybdenum-iron protein alpha/beta subunit